MNRSNDRPGDGFGSAPPFTRREREVLALMASGRSTKEIARFLGLSPRTVYDHVGSIIGKTGARNRLQAIVLAMRPRDAGAVPASDA